MYDALHRAMHGLQETGPEGFEGLVLRLVSRLTGRRFFLAKSGAQAGRDASTAGYGETWLDIECKRYKRDSSPRTRDLLGGLTEAIAGSQRRLDLWLVVSTGRIGATEAQEVRMEGEQQGVAVEMLDWGETGLPQLAVLCAELPGETLDALRDVRITGVERELAEVRNRPGFSDQVSDLRQRLSAGDLGLDHARAAANAWIEARLANRDEAKVAFHQTLCVGDAGFQRYVERRTAQAALDTWYAGWPEHQKLAAILGPEGVGKSWVTLGWWQRLAVKPLTLVITANREVRGDAVTILAATLAAQMPKVRDEAFWRRRVRQWLERPEAAAPRILVILDGLNERQREAWDQVFAAFAGLACAGRVAVIATCRPEFWSDHVAPLLPDGMLVQEIRVLAFDDDELREAWGEGSPGLEELPAKVQAFIRTPRVLRVARLHVAGLIESGDITVERLLMEDWARRRELRSGLAHSVRDFNELVISLARDLRQGCRDFEPDQLRAYSNLARRSPDRNLDLDFAEIIDGQLFKPLGEVTGRYCVRPEHVGLALGMLVAREARDAHRHSGRVGVEQVLGDLDPVSDFDQASATLRGACTVAWWEPEYPRDARQALLQAWLRLANPDPDQWHDFAAYVPRDPAGYFDLAEEFWVGDAIYPTAREWIADAILRWRSTAHVRQLMVQRCRRWLGFWSADWGPYTGGSDVGRVARHREVVRKNLAALRVSVSRLPGHLICESPNENAPDIARLALLLISHEPRLLHIAGFSAWALSRAVMELPGEFAEVAWCLWLNLHDPDETETALLGVADEFLEDGSEVGTRAARYLLAACGTAAAATRLARLPAPAGLPPWFAERVQEVDALDPAVVAPGDMAELAARLAELDPGGIHTQMGLTEEDHRLERLEPMLARCGPRALADFHRRLLRTAPLREGLALRQLGWRVPGLVLLIGPEEASTLDQARRSLLPILKTKRHDAPSAEAYILLGLLAHLPADQQLGVLDDRPEDALDLLLFEGVLAAPPTDLANHDLVRLAAEGPVHRLRRLLRILGQYPVALNDEARAALVRCFGHPDPWVRAGAFAVAATSQDPVALRTHAEGQWKAAPDSNIREAFYGSLALIAGSRPVRYLTLRVRVSPDLLGYLATCDGSSEGIEAFAKDLNALWRTMRGPIPSSEAPHVRFRRTPPSDQGAPGFELMDIHRLAESALQTIQVFGRGPSTADLERFFDQGDARAGVAEARELQERIVALVKEAQRAGRALFGRSLRHHGLRDVVEHRPDLYRKWVAALEPANARSWDMMEFYRALCAALGPTRPDLAAEVLTRLRDFAPGPLVTYSPWNVDSLTWLAFGLPSSETVDAVRERLLSEAHTDELLFQVALTVQTIGQTEWLVHVVRRDLAGPGLAPRARALTLIGFLDEDPAFEDLEREMQEQEGFLKQVATSARGRLEQNRRARVWFEEFLTRRDPAEAWAAFRLFLRCVDRRFHLWRDRMIGGVPGLPALWRHQVTLSEQDIRHAAERNEGRLSETLFGQRISRNEVAPWYVAPPSVRLPRIEG